MGSGAYNFEGSSYILVNPSLNMNLYQTFSTSSWIKTTSSTEAPIIGRGLNGRIDHTYEHSIEEGKNSFFWASGYSFGSQDKVQGSKIINDGQWHHVVATASPTQISVYTDGVLEATKVRTTMPNSNTNLKIYIGKLPGYPVNFKGTIDELKIYNRELTYDDVIAEYNAGNRLISRAEIQRT